MTPLMSTARRSLLSQLKWGVLLSYVSMGLGIILSLVYTPFMLRLLGQSEYGLYSLVASVVSQLHLLSFGFGGAYVRYHARAAVGDRHGEVARLNGLFMVVFSVIGVISVLVGVFLAANIGAVLGDKLSAAEIATARILTGLMTFTVALSFPASVFSSFITVNERFVFQRLLQLARTVATPVLTLIVLLLGYDSVGMAVVAAFVAVTVTMMEIKYCLSKLDMDFSFKGLDVQLLKEIAVFSFYIFINMLVDQVNWNVDKFILGRVGGTVSVAVYAIGAQLTTYYMSLSTTVSSVFVPRVNRLVATVRDNEELTLLFTRVGRIQFLVLALVASGFAVYGRPFINRWAGVDYTGAYPIALLLMIAITIPLTQNLGIEIQRAKDLHRFRSWLYLGMALLNIAVSIPLAQHYGGLGAAAGTAATQLLANTLIMNVYYHKRVGLDMKYFWRQILRIVPALAPALAFGTGTAFLVDLTSVSNLILCGLIFVGVYAGSMWVFGMNAYEKHLFSRLAIAPRRQGNSM